MAAASLVEPFSFSLKVAPSIEDAAISSEKVAMTLAAWSTSVALDAGTVLVTVSAVLSAGEEHGAPWQPMLPESSTVPLVPSRTARGSLRGGA